MQTYNIGLIGFGYIGKVHATALQEIPLFYSGKDFRCAVTKVCTSRMETAVKAQETLGGNVEAVCDIRQVLEDPSIAIIDVCTPNDLHIDTLLPAMAAQKHIYCDKPLTGTLDQALAIEKALPAYHGIAQMTLPYRFYPGTMKAKQLIDEGRIGEVFEFRANFLHSGNANPNAPMRWKLQAGTVADLGSHILDLMTWLVGPFAIHSATTHIAYPTRHAEKDATQLVPVTAEDNMFVLAKLPNGAAGVISASKIATGIEERLEFEIHGSKGALRWNSADFTHLGFFDRTGNNGWQTLSCLPREGAMDGFPTPKVGIGWLYGHLHCMYTFIKSVHLHQQLGPGLDVGIAIQKMMQEVKDKAQK